MTSKAVYFDLDDTLYPYAAYARTGLQAAADYLAGRTGRQLGDELYEMYFEDGVTTGTFDRLVGRYEDIPVSIVDDLIEAFHGSNVPLEPYAATEPLLQRLSGSAYRLGVITDGRNGREKLQRLGLTTYFGVTVVTPELGTSKHHREPFERALAALSVAPEDAVYVGDDPRVDFAVPNRLGMGTIRLRRGRYAHLDAEEPRAAADAEVDTLGRLPTVFASRPRSSRWGESA